MSELTLSKMSNGLEITKPQLDRAYDATIRDLTENWENRGQLRKIFDLTDIDGEIELTFKHLSFSVITKRRFVFLEGTLIVKMSFIYSEGDEDKSLLDFYIDQESVIRLDDASQGEVLDFRYVDSLGYKLFDKIIIAADSKKLISV